MRRRGVERAAQGERLVGARADQTGCREHGAARHREPAEGAAGHALLHLLTPCIGTRISRSDAARTARGQDRYGRMTVQAGATVSALVAPRAPSGFSAPGVVSRLVWCSISAFNSAPTRTTIAEIQIQVMKPIAAPSEP